MIHHHYFPCRTVADLDEVNAGGKVVVKDAAAREVVDAYRFIVSTFDYDAATRNP